MSESEPGPQINHVELTADVVSAYVSNNSIPSTDLPALIAQVHTALAGLAAPQPAAEETVERPTPAQIRKSITADHLISFIDGKSYKTLKRHLRTHGLDFETYRQRYGLPADYPTVSSNYSAARSALAKDLGLGQQRRPAAGKAAAPAETASQAGEDSEDGAPKARGGRRKAVATTDEAPKKSGRRKAVQAA